jgi:N-acetylneuraminic acid mutarotase
LTSSHSATVAADNKLVVFGGQGEGSFLRSKILNDLYILDASKSLTMLVLILVKLTWSKVKIQGEIRPSERFSHAAAFVPRGSVHVHGGYDGYTHFNDLYIFDLGKKRALCFF